MTSNDVKNVIIWGNHSSTQYPDVNHAKVNVKGKEVGVYEAIKDDSWLKGDFILVRSWFLFIYFLKRTFCASAFSELHTIINYVPNWLGPPSSFCLRISRVSILSHLSRVNHLQIVCLNQLFALENSRHCEICVNATRKIHFDCSKKNLVII